MAQANEKGMRHEGHAHVIPPSKSRPRVEADFLLRGATQVLTMPADRGPVRSGPEDVGLVEGGGGACVAARNGEVVWVGVVEELENAVSVLPEARIVDAAGLVVLPGLVDAHTHLVFAGERSAEFHRRNAGATYQEIAAAGGGILSTVRATRAASEAELVSLSLPRASRSLDFGVTTLEVKSGYGLDLATELKILRAVRSLDAIHPAEVVPTFLGAHTVPEEFRGTPGGMERYVAEVVERMIPAVAKEGLAAYCDVFVEEGAFTPEEGRRVLEAGKAHGLRPRVHADQFTPGAGAELAAAVGAASADHLEEVSADGIRALARAGTVAVLLPGVSLFLGSCRWSPARRLLEGGVRVALATDCNPGSCYTENLLLMTTLGCTYLKMTAEEALAAVTVEAARSLDRADRVGRIAPGTACDLAGFHAPHYRYLPYHFGAVTADLVVKGGVPVRPLCQAQAPPGRKGGAFPVPRKGCAAARALAPRTPRRAGRPEACKRLLAPRAAAG